MSNWEWCYLISSGIVLLVMYTWCVIDIAATTALRRLEAMIIADAAEEEDSDIVNELDRMWNRKHGGGSHDS